MGGQGGGSEKAVGQKTILNPDAIMIAYFANALLILGVAVGFFIVLAVVLFESGARSARRHRRWVDAGEESAAEFAHRHACLTIQQNNKQTTKPCKNI